MMKLTAKAQAAFDKIFPERQIYHRSGGTVRYVSVSPWQQAIMAAGGAAVATWCGFVSVHYLWSSGSAGFDGADRHELAKYERWVQELRAKDALSRALLEERTDNFQRVTEEFERRHETLKAVLASLETGEEVDLAALQGDGAAILVEASIEEADARTSKSLPPAQANVETAGMRARIDQLRGQQERFLAEAEDIAADRAESARGVLKLTSVGVGRIASTTEMGGPLVDMSAFGLTESSDPEEIAFANRVVQVKARLEEAAYYTQIMDNLPLATPIGVPSRLTSQYGVRVDPITKRPGWHEGIDMGAFYKAPIVAAGPGKVVYAGYKSGYGRVVDVDHGYGFKTRYGHLHSVKVKKGDDVAIGETVGLMGSSGRSTGPHLHYEVRFNGNPYNPENFLKAGRHVHED